MVVCSWTYIVIVVPNTYSESDITPYSCRHNIVTETFSCRTINIRSFVSFFLQLQATRQLEAAEAEKQHASHTASRLHSACMCLFSLTSPKSCTFLQRVIVKTASCQNGLKTKVKTSTKKVKISTNLQSKWPQIKVITAITKKSEWP